MSRVKLVKDTNKNKKGNKKKAIIIGGVSVISIALISFILYQTKVFGPTERQLKAEAKEIGLSVELYKPLRVQADRQLTVEDLKEYKEIAVENVSDITGISNMENLENIVLMNNKLYTTSTGETHVHEDGTTHVIEEQIVPEGIAKMDLSELGKLDNLSYVYLAGHNYDFESYFDSVENPEALTRFFISDSDIKELTGIERFTNLKDLSITHSYELSNIEALANLKSLETLQLHGSYALLGSITELDNLKYLFISSNTLDLTGLSKLNNLSTVVMRAETFYNMNELSELNNLTELAILDADLTEIPYLRNIEKLTLQNLDKLESLESVKALKTLKELRITSSDALDKDDISVLKSSLTSLENLSIRNCERLNSEVNEITLNNLE